MNNIELAMAIKDGFSRDNIGETQDAYLIEPDDDDPNEPCLVCALGAALVSKYNGDWKEASAIFTATRDAGEGSGWVIMAKLLEIPVSIAEEVSGFHATGKMTPGQISNWLLMEAEEWGMEGRNHV
jgi:hypothetical protein